ncbi:MAG: long-chain fatty acid--CoA ligase, partial [bacterium]
DEERTQRVIDPLGWFHTGDLGEIVEDGLKITCRVDDLFKLSNGEKVSSMLVENRLTITSQLIQHALAVGSGENFVSALVFLNMPNLERWAKKKGIELPKGWELSKNVEIRDLVASEIANNMADFQPKYMRVKAFVIVPSELSLEAGELTPTMKVIRHRILEKYCDWVDAIYRPANHPDKRDCIVSIQ